MLLNILHCTGQPTTQNDPAPRVRGAEAAEPPKDIWLEDSLKTSTSPWHQNGIRAGWLLHLRRGLLGKGIRVPWPLGCQYGQTQGVEEKEV